MKRSEIATTALAIAAFVVSWYAPLRLWYHISSSSHSESFEVLTDVRSELRVFRESVRKNTDAIRLIREWQRGHDQNVKKAMVELRTIMSLLKAKNREDE